MNQLTISRFHGIHCLVALTLSCVCLGRLPAQSNLVYNGSFELGESGWGWGGGGLSVNVNNPTAYDGYTFLEPEGYVWQDLATVPGRDYYVQFATRNGTTIAVDWGPTNSVTLSLTNSDALSISWVLGTAAFTANTNLTRLKFRGMGGGFRLDGIEVRWLQEPVMITIPVPSRSTFESGSASFPVVAIGAPPLRYQWYREAGAIAGATNRVVTLTNLALNDSGDFWVRITNNYGSVESLRAKLIVNPMPLAPLIVTQPKSQTIVEGYGTSFYVVAFGSTPLNYQWRLFGTNLPSETNSQLLLPVVTNTLAGPYSVVVNNQHGSVSSLEATLQTMPAGTGGGWVQLTSKSQYINSPMFDTDGVTRLAGSNYVAQLYAGAAPNTLRPIGVVTYFRSGAQAGYFYQATRTIPDVPFEGRVYTQVRAWDYTSGRTYEEARARGGRTGKSNISSQITHDPNLWPPELVDFRSFSLEAGASALATARFELVAVNPNRVIEWMLIGDAGYNYVLESRDPPNDWSPIQILTNATGVVNFTITNGTASQKFLRARIVEP